jgi:hypothetical protein
MEDVIPRYEEWVKYIQQDVADCRQPAIWVWEGSNNHGTVKDQCFIECYSNFRHWRMYSLYQNVFVPLDQQHW